MGRVSKSEKFELLKTHPLVMDKDPSAKGKWQTDFFKNNHPIIVELACDKGEYTLGMAKLFPEKNFIGMDIKGNRIWSSARLAQLDELTNVGYIRDQIDKLEDYFLPGEIDEIWITFSDPFPKKRDAKRRLTSNRFLPIYKKLLKTGGKIHLKTDSDILYEFTKEVLATTPCIILKDYSDVYAMNKQEELFGIQTYYEKMHISDGKTIKYLCFSLVD